MPTYRRVARQEFPSTDAARRGLTDVAYVYMDERFQTVMVTLPLEQDTPARVQELLLERARAAAAGGPEEVIV